MELENVNIGEVINKWNRTHFITQAKFAQLLGMPTTNAARLLKKKTIETNLLQFISMQLKHNFFQVFVSVQDNDVEDCPHAFVHIGESINRRLKELRMQQVDFAARLGIYQPEVSKIIKKGSIDTGKLAAISKILDYNFFEEFYYNLSGIEHKNKYNMETRTTDLLKRLVLFHGAKPEAEAIQEYARVIEKEIRKSICDEIMKNVTENVTEK